MNIVLVGHVCIDHNLIDDHSYKNWGSTLMYMANYCQTYLKNNPTLIAPHGLDFKPYSDGIKLIPKAQNIPTLIYENNVKDGVRTQVCKHTSSANPVELTSTIKGVIATADIIAVAPILPNFSAAYVRDILSTRKPGSLSVLLAQGYFRRVKNDGRVVHREFEEALAILPLFDLVIFSDEDSPAAINKAKEWSQKTKACFIVTEGKLGASAINSNIVTHVETRHVPSDKIIDPVGSGDTFGMAAMYSYYKNKDVETALSEGNRAARTVLLQAMPEE